MAGFYIKKVVAKSAIKGDASVSFGKGLTIIQGRSDSGKTCVANCIDFVFGGFVRAQKAVLLIIAAALHRAS